MICHISTRRKPETTIHLHIIDLMLTNQLTIPLITIPLPPSYIQGIKFPMLHSMTINGPEIILNWSGPAHIVINFHKTHLILPIFIDIPKGKSQVASNMACNISHMLISAVLINPHKFVSEVEFVPPGAVPETENYSY